MKGTQMSDTASAHFVPSGTVIRRLIAAIDRCSRAAPASPRATATCLFHSDACKYCVYGTAIFVSVHDLKLYFRPMAPVFGPFLVSSYIKKIRKRGHLRHIAAACSGSHNRLRSGISDTKIAELATLDAKKRERDLGGTMTDTVHATVLQPPRLSATSFRWTATGDRASSAWR